VLRAISLRSPPPFLESVLEESIDQRRPYEWVVFIPLHALKVLGNKLAFFP